MTDLRLDFHSKLDLSYIDHLQRSNANELAFYPLSALEKASEAGQMLQCYDNDEPAGYLWFGSVRPGYDITIYQACVDYDSRKRHLGWGMVKDLVQIGKSSAALGIRLKCRSSSEANEFWQAIGFYCTSVTKGGLARAAMLNHWRTDLTESLFTLEPVEASTKNIDPREYNKMKKDGVKMLSRWSRTKEKQ